MNPTKPDYLSKTIWFNILYTGLVWLNTHLGMFNLNIDTVVVVQAAINLLLRYITTQPVSFILAPKAPPRL